MDGYYSVGVQPSLRFPIERRFSDVKDILSSVGRGAFLGCLSVGLAGGLLVFLSATRQNFLLALQGWTAQSVATTQLASNEPVVPGPTKPTVAAAVTTVPSPLPPAPSNSSALNQLIAQFAASHPGSYTVATTQLGVQAGISASYHESDSMNMASTYKVFMAYLALQRVEQGKLAMNTVINGHTLDYCLQQMILVSDNPCGEAVGSKVGWRYADIQLHRDGFTHTFLNSASNTPSSAAADESKLLTKLQNGSLLNAEHTGYLLSLMKRQVFRSGIPAGSSGAEVADKVGDLDTVHNDMAIVFAPKATYSLVIMTNNANSSAIRDLAQQIYNFYDQHSSL